MKIVMTKLSVAVLTLTLAAQAHSSDWNLKTLEHEIKLPEESKFVKIRTGHMKANPNVKFKGNVLYLEGLGDSMMNHAPLFTTLTDAGYRVIAFDYMGQGGSEGSMNYTRVLSKTLPDLQISAIAEQVWEMHKKKSKRNKKSVIGWSTGGLAAYEMAVRKWAHAVVLLAPGVCPNMTVGEGILSWPPNKISLRTLTTAAPYRNKDEDPHVDPIRPVSAVKAPYFAYNLLDVAGDALSWESKSSNVKGLVMLSGDNDNYVDSSCAKEVFVAQTNFEILQYDEALHEIDNEKEPIRKRMQADILNFLERAL